MKKHRTFSDYLEEKKAHDPSYVSFDEEYLEFKLKAIGELLKEERKKAGYSQEALALAIHTKKSAISRLERHAQNVTVGTIIKVCRFLGKEVDLIFH